MRLVSFAGGVGELADGAVRVLEAGSMLEWLHGSGRAATGEERAVEDVALLAPLPVPASFRDFLTHQGHYERAMRNLTGDPAAAPPRHWFDAPAFYFSNHHAILGPGAPVRRPPDCTWLDFELELAAVVGADGDIAGFTLLNDWSARDIQVLEGPVGLGPHKAKDFGTSLGPWLVTPDELDYTGGRVALAAKVIRNGETVVETRTDTQRFTWPELLRAAARNTRLVAGDVLGSGTLEWGCLLETGPPAEVGWLQPGEQITLAADGLGELPTPIAT
jgi:2-keto-4-pentenoate hydratase/2-oxohepta-3-ene-1,7-dioic acid hydratase in catechol pathway